MHKEEKTNKYLAEAKLQGYTAEQMLRAATMAEQITQHLGGIATAEKGLSDIIAWLCIQPENESVLTKDDMRVLGALLLGLKGYTEANCGMSEQLLEETAKN